MKAHLYKLLSLLEKDDEFVYHLKEFKNDPKYRPYEVEDIRYLQTVVHTVQIFNDSFMLDCLRNMINIPRITDDSEKNEAITNFLGYDYIDLVEYSVEFSLDRLSKDEIFSLWEKINSLYFRLVFKSILNHYPHIVDDR